MSPCAFQNREEEEKREKRDSLADNGEKGRQAILTLSGNKGGERVQAVRPGGKEEGEASGIGEGKGDGK